MNKSIVAGAALLIAAAVAMPLSAWSAGETAPPPPPAAPAAGPPPAPAAGPPAPAARPAWGQWPAHRGGPMMGMRMMWRHRMMRRSPQQMCERRLARHAAHVAYVTALLDLTPAQRPLYDKVRSAMDAATAQQQQLCASLPTPDQRGEQTVLDRFNRREQFLQAHLQALQQVEPALQQLYQSLTSVQKEIINHPFRHRG